MKAAAQSQFDAWAASYDGLILNRLLFHPSYRAIIEEIVRHQAQTGRQPGRALDIGCGTGSLLMMLRQANLLQQGVGLDYAERMCHAATDKAKQHGMDDRLRFLHGDSEHLPFADASFDVVTSSNSFHHYPHQAAAVAEMRRVLRPGGRLIVVDGFRDNVIGWFVFDVCVRALEGHVHHAPWSEMHNLFSQAGLTDLSHAKHSLWLPLLLTAGTAPA